MPAVDDSVVGQRAAALVDLPMRHFAAQPFDPANPVFAAAIRASVIAGINAACAPGGAIKNVIDASEQRQIARYRNLLMCSGAAALFPLVDANGVAPANFPPTINDFWAMNGALVDQLLASYNLPGGGLLAAKKSGWPIIVPCNR